MEKRTYGKENIITISKGAPVHLLTYWMGILVGMGIPYKIDPESPLYRTLQECRIERLKKLIAAREIKDRLPFEKGYRAFHESGDADSITVSVRPIHET